MLDCGYGQGSWAVAMAETYTESVVRQALFLFKILSRTRKRGTVEEFHVVTVLQCSY